MVESTVALCVMGSREQDTGQLLHAGGRTWGSTGCCGTSMAITKVCSLGALGGLAAAVAAAVALPGSPGTLAGPSPGAGTAQMHKCVVRSLCPLQLATSCFSGTCLRPMHAVTTRKGAPPAQQLHAQHTLFMLTSSLHLPNTCSLKGCRDWRGLIHSLWQRGLVGLGLRLARYPETLHCAVSRASAMRHPLPFLQRPGGCTQPGTISRWMLASAKAA